MTPLEAFYGQKCQFQLYWDGVNERILTRPESIQSTKKKVAVVREKLKIAQDW